MTTLPAWLPAALAVCLVAVPVCAVGAVVSAAVDRAGARRQKHAQPPQPGVARKQAPKRS